MLPRAFDCVNAELSSCLINLACPVCGATSLTGRPMLKAASLNSMTFVRSSFCCVFLLVLYCFKTCLPLSLDQYV